MEELNINTVAGKLELAPATLDELKLVAAQWPMGVVFRQAETEANGLVFQVGEQEAYGIKLQPPDTDERTAKALYFDQSQQSSQSARQHRDRDRPAAAPGAWDPGNAVLVQGGKVLAIQHPLRQEQPFWAFALRAGFSKLAYAPMIAAAVPGPPNAPHAWLDRVKILSERLKGMNLEQT